MDYVTSVELFIDLKPQICEVWPIMINFWYSIFFDEKNKIDFVFHISGMTQKNN